MEQSVKECWFFRKRERGLKKIKEEGRTDGWSDRRIKIRAR